MALVPASSRTSPITLATKTLTNAEVLALPHPTTVELVAAPGAGFALMPLHATLRLTWVADYTNIDASAAIQLLCGTGVALGVLDQSGIGGGISNFLAGGEDASAFLPPLSYAPGVGTRIANGTGGLYDSDIENKALYLWANNGAASDFTGGNAGNSLKVSILYYVVTF